MSTTIALYLFGAGAVLMLLGGLGSLFLFRRYHFVDGRVCGVIGLMGSGKSMFVTAKVLLPAAAAIRSRQGLWSTTGRQVRRIITNTTLDLDGIGLGGVEHVQVIPNEADGTLWDQLAALVRLVDRGDGCGEVPALDAVIVIDEAHIFAPADKLKMADKARWFCSMLRKLNAELWWISQSEMKVHKRLRDDSSLIWMPQRFRGWFTLLFGRSKWFVAQSYEPEMLRRAARKPVDRRFFRMSRRVLRAYRSFELIAPDPGADLAGDSTRRPLAFAHVLELNPVSPASRDDETGRTFDLRRPVRPVPVSDDELSQAAG